LSSAKGFNISICTVHDPTEFYQLSVSLSNYLYPFIPECYYLYVKLIKLPHNQMPDNWESSNIASVHVVKRVWCFMDCIFKRKWWWLMNCWCFLPYSHCFSAVDVLNGVAWSESLDRTFRWNYEDDPTLTWQYFGSSSGFFRMYPGKDIFNH